MIVNTNKINSKYKAIIKNDIYQVRIVGDQNKNGIVNNVQQRNTLSLNGNQFPIQMIQSNPNISMEGSFYQNNQSFQNHSSCYFPAILQKSIDVQRQSFEFHSQDTASKSVIQDMSQNINEKNEETVKKTRQMSFSGDSQTPNIKPLQLQINNMPSVDNFSTVKGGDQSVKCQTGSLSFKLTNQSFDSSIINSESQKNNIIQKNINSSETVDKNKEISQKVMLLIQEIERLQMIIDDNLKENKILQDKVDFLQRDRSILQASLQDVKINTQRFQQNSELNQQNRQDLYKTIENIQLQLQNSQKEKEESKSKLLDLNIKIEQVIQENEKILSINECLFKEKQNLQEDVQQKELNLNIYRAQIEDITKELRSKNEIIRFIENEKISWNKQLKQIEMLQEQQNIDTDKIDQELLELQNSNDQLIKNNKYQLENLENLTQKHEEVLNANKVLQNELSFTREQTTSNKEELLNQISQLQKENREYQLKCESFTNQNHQLNLQIADLQTYIKDITQKMDNLQEFINKNQLKLSQLNSSVQLEKNQFLLEEQKIQQLQKEIQEFTENNSQLQQNINEYQSRYQEQIQKQQKLENTIEKQKQQIFNQSGQLKENQSVYNNVHQNSQDLLIINEYQLKSNEQKKQIEQLNNDKLELINKINLLLVENENVLLANENLEKQLKSKIEEKDNKQKLVLQLQKENENFLLQMNNLSLSDKVDIQQGIQQNQNIQLQQNLTEKESEIFKLNREITILTKEMEEIRIKLIQYQQKENMLNSENAIQQQTNHFKSQLSSLKIVNDKLSNENLQLYDLLKLRKQEILILQEKLDKRQINTNFSFANHSHFNTTSKDQ